MIGEKKTEGRVVWIKETQGADEMGNMYLNMCVYIHKYINAYINVLKEEPRQLRAGLVVCERKRKLNIE